MADPTVETVNPLELNEDSPGAVIETAAEKADRLIAEHNIREPLHDATYTLVEHGNFDLEELTDTDMINTLEAFDRLQDWATSGPLGTEQGTMLSEAVARATVEPDLMDDFIDDLLDDNTFNDPSTIERLFSDDTQLTQFITSQMAASGAGGNFQNAFSHGDDDSTRLSGGRRKSANSGLETASTMGLLNSADIQGMINRIVDIDRRREEITAEKEAASAKMIANEAEMLHLQTSILPEIDRQIKAEEATNEQLRARIAFLKTEIERMESLDQDQLLELVNSDLAKFATIDVDTNEDGRDNLRIVYRNEDGEYYVLAEDTNEPVLVKDLPNADRLLERIDRELSDEEKNLTTGDQDPEDAADFNKNLFDMYGSFGFSPHHSELLEAERKLTISDKELERLSAARTAAQNKLTQLTEENAKLQSQLDALDAEDATLAEERRLLEKQIKAGQALAGNLDKQQELQGSIISTVAAIEALGPAPASNSEGASEWQTEYTKLSKELKEVQDQLDELNTLQQDLAELEQRRSDIIEEAQKMVEDIEDLEVRADTLERLETGMNGCTAGPLYLADPDDPRFNDADRAYLEQRNDVSYFLGGKQEPLSLEGTSDYLRSLIQSEEIGAHLEAQGWEIAQIDRDISTTKERVSETSRDATTDNTENLTLEGPAPGEMEREEVLRNQAMNYAAEISANPYVVEADLEGYFGELSGDELDLVISVLEDKGIEVDRHETDDPAPEEELVANAETSEPTRESDYTISAPGVSV